MTIHVHLMAAILDSLKDPLVFVDTDHIIRYMNKAAQRHYEEGVALIGRSIFHCHNEQSRQTIHEVFDAFHRGEEERLITDNEKHRIFMRAIRDANGHLVGYYERYEPSVKNTPLDEDV
ncbi:MAG: PAS domain-containing protein [Gemmatimonadota bacterium]|nr:MAG: PAS domain-containing protein [Gemmatimonadota bacterium]